MPVTPEMRHVPNAIFSSGTINERAWKVPAVIAVVVCLWQCTLWQSLRASLHHGCYAVTLLLYYICWKCLSSLTLDHLVVLNLCMLPLLEEECIYYRFHTIHCTYMYAWTYRCTICVGLVQVHPIIMNCQQPTHHLKDSNTNTQAISMHLSLTLSPPFSPGICRISINI